MTSAEQMSSATTSAVRACPAERAASGAGATPCVVLETAVATVSNGCHSAPRTQTLALYDTTDSMA